MHENYPGEVENKARKGLKIALLQENDKMACLLHSS